MKNSKMKKEFKVIAELLPNNTRVLDVGCGYNEFKGKINNLIGIDPYNNKADLEVGTLQFRTDQKFDVILCLGSVNFGSRDKIIAEVGRCVDLLAEGGTMSVSYTHLTLPTILRV